MDRVVIGRINGPHGISGAVRITSSTDPPDNIMRYRPWLISLDDDVRELEVRWVKPHGAGYVAALAGVDDRDRAAALGGAHIAVPRTALPELDADHEYYWRDLIGMAVADTRGCKLGQVQSLLATGAHDVLVIHDGEQETLVPFVATFVVEVDPVAGRITVDWQE